MVDAARRILQVCNGIPGCSLLDDVDRSDIVLWRLTVLGEAAKNVPATVRAAYPKVEWSAAARLRDRVVHHYEGVDAMQIAHVVNQDLPALLAALEPLQSELLAEWERRQAAAGAPSGW
jgi:uncharacterized protein with HEPN domain